MLESDSTTNHSGETAGKPSLSHDHYATLSAKARLSLAQEMAREMHDHARRMEILVHAIQDYIDPYRDSGEQHLLKGEDAEIMLDNARELLCVLVEQMTNKGQQQHLIECLAAMGNVEVGHG